MAESFPTFSLPYVLGHRALIFLLRLGKILLYNILHFVENEKPIGVALLGELGLDLASTVIVCNRQVLYHW